MVKNLFFVKLPLMEVKSLITFFNYVTILKDAMVCFLQRYESENDLGPN